MFLAIPIRHKNSDLLIFEPASSIKLRPILVERTKYDPYIEREFSNLYTYATQRGRIFPGCECDANTSDGHA